MQSGIEGTIINVLQALALECLWEERLKQKKKKLHWNEMSALLPKDQIHTSSTKARQSVYLRVIVTLSCWPWSILTKETSLMKIWGQFFQLLCFNLLGYCSYCLFITWKKKIRQEKENQPTISLLDYNLPPNQSENQRI